jgi:hypothetical protein
MAKPKGAPTQQNRMCGLPQEELHEAVRVVRQPTAALREGVCMFAR